MRDIDLLGTEEIKQLKSIVQSSLTEKEVNLDDLVSVLYKDRYDARQSGEISEIVGIYKNPLSKYTVLDILNL